MKITLAFVTFVGAALLHASPAHAGLDEQLTTTSDVESVHVAAQTLRVRTRQQVKEYAGTDGKVFAVSWEGAFLPNMREMLGAHFDEYAAAVHARRVRNHHHLHIETPTLAVDVISRGNYLIGKAFVPTRLPKGVTIDALR